MKLTGNKYLQSQFNIKSDEASYNPDSIKVGVDNQGRVFRLDMSEGIRIVALGIPGCLSNDTNILINDKNQEIGNFKDGDVIKTKSYDFKKKEFVDSESFVIDSGEKEVFEIKFDDGRIIKASSDHVFFVISKDGFIIEKNVSELKEDDILFEKKTREDMNG